MNILEANNNLSLYKTMIFFFLILPFSDKVALR